MHQWDSLKIRDYLRPETSTREEVRMHVALEFFWVLLQTIYYFAESFVYLFIPSNACHKNVKGQKVLITGSGSGLGRLMALRFAALGSELVLWDINAEGNEETAKHVRAHGAKVACYTVDLSDREKIYETANKVKVEVGDVDILINNAGIVTGKKFMKSADALIEKTMQVNTMALFWTTKAFLPSMLTRNHGHIVNIASAAGLVGTNGLCDYCASKFAAVGFNESLQNELAALGKNGVHTTGVCPMYINTGMFTGAKSRFEWLIPNLEPDYAVDRIMDAVLTNSHQLLMPRVLILLMALKWLWPIKVQLVLAQFLGITSSMDEFVGHSKSTVSKSQ
jgi:all-trans-retinol dehydrogenase (NAD+)